MNRVPAPGQGGRRPTSRETGDPGLWRLFNRQLAGQISWLLPLAGLGFLAVAWQSRPRFPLASRHRDLLLWAVWLLPMVVFFSVANLFHRYYLEMLAPAIAALVGAGVVALWKDYGRSGWRGWLLPLALVGSAAFEAVILSEFPDWSRWLTPLVVGGGLMTAMALVVVRLVRCLDERIWARVAAGIGVLTLLVPMTVWAFIPVWYEGSTNLPYAGPELLEEPGHRGNIVEGADPLVDYLRANHGDETYLAATLNANTAAPIILATGEPVMAMGGFTGSDPILTMDELAEMVADGVVRFFLVGSLQGENRPQQNALSRWVTGHCTAVPQVEWGALPAGLGGPSQLFDCSSS